MKPTLVKAPPNCRAETSVKLHPPLHPTSTHDTRADRLSRRLKIALKHLQKQAEQKILEDSPQDFSWSKHVGDDGVEPNKFQLIPGEHCGVCKVKLAYEQEDRLPRRTAHRSNPSAGGASHSQEQGSGGAQKRKTNASKAKEKRGCSNSSMTQRT